MEFLIEHKSNGNFIDGTCGCGGHSKAILERTSGNLLCVDRDINVFQ